MKHLLKHICRTETCIAIYTCIYVERVNLYACTYLECNETEFFFKSPHYNATILGFSTIMLLSDTIAVNRNYVVILVLTT